jgi:hypothetical protein
MQAIKRHGLIITFKFVHIPHNITTISLLCYLLEVWSIITNKVGHYQKKVGCGCALNLNTKATILEGVQNKFSCDIIWLSQENNSKLKSA